MTKPLRSYPEKERPAIARRREASGTKGLGYWAAVDYLRKTAQKERGKE